MIPSRFRWLAAAALACLVAPAPVPAQTALQPVCTDATKCTRDDLPSAFAKLYGNDLFLQTLVANRFNALGAAALLNIGSVAGTVADGGALTAEANRAQAAEGANAAAIAVNTAAIVTETSRAQGVEALKAPLASPAFTGIPTVPTAVLGTATTQAASTSFVAAAVAAGASGNQGVPPSRLVVGGGLATGGGDLTTDRTITVPKAAQSDVAAGTDDAKALTSYSVAARFGALAPLASPALVGAPTAPTAVAGTNTTQIATMAALTGSAVRNDLAQNPSSAQIAQALSNAGVLIQPQGRLTLASGAPVATGPVSAAATIYYAPYGGQLALVGTGLTTAPVPVVFAEVSQALSDATKSPAAAAAGQVYDLFSWMDGPTFRVTRGPAWSAGATAGSNTQRGAGAGSTELVRVAGVLVNKNAIVNGPAAGMGVYLGTISTDASGATVSWVPGSSAAGGGAAILNVWNAYNRVPVETQVVDTSASTAYNSSIIRALNGSTSNRVTFVRGLDEEGVSATIEVIAVVITNDGAAYAGIGLDITNNWSSPAGQGYVPTGRWGGTIFASYRGRPGAGAHYLQAVQNTSNTAANFGGVPFEALSFSGRF